MIHSSSLTPVLKWPGGKTGELNVIIPHMPRRFDNYFEPFVGGAAVLLTVPAGIPAFANDISKDLIELYRNIASGNPDFFRVLAKFATSWKDLQALTERHAQLLSSLYQQYSRNQLQEVGFRDQLHAFLVQNRSFLINCLAPECDYDVEHFVREVRHSLYAKTRRMKKLEQENGTLPFDDVLSNIEGSFKSAFYTHLRYIYNHSTTYSLSSSHQAAIFFFIRENAYASMFRFNKKGQFNIPYGGISYNRKDLGSKIVKMRDSLLIKRLQTTTFGNTDFHDFLEIHPPQQQDYVFLDPPYDTEFSDYDQNVFGPDDQKRLADYLLHNCKARFMLIIKATELIWSLYGDRGLQITAFDKKYMYTVKDRNSRDTVHLMIRNYSED